MKQEIIGEEMEIVDSRNKDLVGLHGKVIDETRNTIVISSNSTSKMILKKGSKFNIAGKEVQGDNLVMRPEDRVKK